MLNLFKIWFPEIKNTFSLNFVFIIIFKLHNFIILSVFKWAMLKSFQDPKNFHSKTLFININRSLEVFLYLNSKIVKN